MKLSQIALTVFSLAFALTANAQKVHYSYIKHLGDHVS